MFNNRFTTLPPVCYALCEAMPVVSPKILLWNEVIAKSLSITLTESYKELIFSGNTKNSLAMAYAGHQFGHFVPSLGDGRAILLGDINGLDVHLKGSGRTPFSRNGDGRATLRAMLREYLISEAMHGLNIPTTRSLAVVTTGENVQRETLNQGAILTRLAKSHIRVGTFQYLAFHGDIAALQALADYCMQHYYPDAPTIPDFFKAVVHAQAHLIARWMLVGFIHGVMNTDNMSITAETIDYGPCAFMDAYHAQTVFSAIDKQGRYAFANQPAIAQWNLARLAESLLQLVDSPTILQKILDGFAPTFEAAWQAGMAKKLGLENAPILLITDLLFWMQETGADFTNTFYRLYTSLRNAAPFAPPAQWVQQWLALNPNPTLMRLANPAIIPRNHLVERVLKAAEAGDMQPFTMLLAAVQNPFHENNAYTKPPTAGEEIRQTFCGT
jgi:serine/tyrosine/threonine adenylyltransferase